MKKFLSSRHIMKTICALLLSITAALSPIPAAYALVATPSAFSPAVQTTTAVTTDTATAQPTAMSTAEAQTTAAPADEKVDGIFPREAIRKISSTDSSADYARIKDEDTVFYADPNCTIPKFVLPCGYFVKVISTSEKSVRIRYMDDSDVFPAREGFILLEHYYAYTETPPALLYPSCKLTVKTDEVLFSDSSATVPKTVLAASSTCIFYGYLSVGGQNYYCVYSDGYVGYVRADAFIGQSIPEHPLPLSEAKDDEISAPDPANQTKETTPRTTNIDSTIKTVIVLAVSLVALSVVYLLFRPDRKRHFAFTEHDRDDLL